MSIHFYTGGTPNGTDGVEITSLTFKNLQPYMWGGGKSVNSGDYNSFAIIPLCVREDEGKIATNVRFTSMSGSNYIGMASWNSYTDYPDGSNIFRLSIDQPYSIDKLSNKNILVFLCVMCNGDIPANSPIVSISYVEDSA